ncbi:PREDICTED: uncharacterized protein LOC106747470 [Dinoponera quadriceps]|uniref:Uncharacterized protein LOC106747470 n=1 Tax=Dinoponera quadriceps TaxID=609295 RepID=A0A6P3XPT0_DINQU|nr:PREDICTED: uncharacterized protein LOC106747470 [Dinoponera quadriceps]
MMYISRILNDNQIMHTDYYVIYKKEILFITHCINHFKLYLYWQSFTFITNYKTLGRCKNAQNICKQILQWRSKFLEYNYDAIYKTGKLIVNAITLLVNFIEITLRNYKTIGRKFKINYNSPKDATYGEQLWEEDTEPKKPDENNNYELYLLDMDEMDDFLTADSTPFTSQKLAESLGKPRIKTHVYAHNTIVKIPKPTKEQVHASESADTPRYIVTRRGVNRLPEADDLFDEAVRTRGCNLLLNPLRDYSTDEGNFVDQPQTTERRPGISNVYEGINAGAKKLYIEESLKRSNWKMTRKKNQIIIWSYHFVINNMMSIRSNKL